MGDFNDPAIGTGENAAKSGRHPLAVAYPTTLGVEAEGFVDTFRTVFPDEMAKPGITWTPTSEPTDKEDHHDRIDFILARAKNLKVISAGIAARRHRRPIWW